MRNCILATALAAVLLVGAARAQLATTRSTTRPASLPSSLATTRPTTRPAPVATQPTLAGAKWLYWHGRYSEAAALYEKLSANPADALPASLGLAEAHAMLGKYDQAIAALKAVEARGADRAEWQTAMAKALGAVGKYDEALAAARQAVSLRPDWAPGILCLGEALETLGKKKEAIEVYNGMAKAVARPDFVRDAASLVAGGSIMDHLAVLSGKKASEQAMNILQNYYQKAYMDVDGAFWPANVAAGAFLLTKYRPDQAEAEFKLADKVNKSLPDVAVGRGIIQLSIWEFEQAIAAADRALAINPRHADALLLKAYALLQWRKYDQVVPVAEKVLAFNPNHLEALSVMAAAQTLLNKPDKAQACIDQVLKINPGYGQLHENLGQWLSAARQFPEAERSFKKAMELAPELAGPVANLGLMYMQTGQEDLAKQTLDKAFALDDYREDVLNYIRLLDQLAKFQVKETAHFILKVDPKTDAVLLDWLADEAEKIHDDVAGDFKYSPPRKILVEMFPNHSSFSVRITGRGWIGTVGACTGGVIAMPAPDPLRGGFGMFNWATVLRHEYTHAVTLALTENRIPHWFTEACAVWEQPDRRNFQAVAMLVDAVRTGKLFPIKTLDWGFIRPRPGQGSRPMAYAQAEWIFEYIVEKKGFETIPQMLNGFRDRLTQAEVFQRFLGTSEEQFDKDFRQWATAQVKSWGYDPNPTPDLAAAAKAAGADPKSADAQAALAQAQHRAGQRDAAEASARKALDIDKNHKRALEILATVQAEKKKYDDAIQTAKRLEEVDPKDAQAAWAKATAYLGKRQWADAIVALEAYKVRREDDPFGYQKLADLYMQMGQAESALPNLVELHHRTMTDPKFARQVADIYRSSATPQKALEFYEQVIQINPYDAGTYKAMASLYLAGGAHDRAIVAMHSACLLEPDSADTWTQMAMVYLRAARAGKSAEKLSEARAAAQKALTLDPACQARDVLQLIDQEPKP